MGLGGLKRAVRANEGGLQKLGVASVDRVLNEQPIGRRRGIVVGLIEAGLGRIVIVREIFDEQQWIGCQQAAVFQRFHPGAAVSPGSRASYIARSAVGCE